MKQQLSLLLTAFGFFTRIPVPFKVAFSQENLNKCNRYLPLVGLVVGGISGLVFYLSALILPQAVAVMLSMITSILLTGAFHEDGLADVCDAFGGGWTKGKILDIMKDSRVGAYGAIGILLALLLKFTTLNEIPPSKMVQVLIAGHMLSRAMAVWTMHSLNYVRDDELSKSKPITKSLQSTDLMIAVGIASLSLILFVDWLAILVVLPAFIVKVLLEQYFKKWIGGYTGDCLGTIQQVSEMMVYLSLLALFTYQASEITFPFIK
ncbi:adenosylcobinamide-GDP ribazoletransferase [Carboxylicivirga taeanensis]|uniref:adenosylcobinamide-GDP ribazoletransferase n=1 Tax=Carboxylicivirga taeanensis TaxID=1416875 RepID=UPI003F6E2C64